jgi:hypothetical protein
MSTTSPNRQPAGVPTGGQFAAKSNPECEVELSEPGATSGPLPKISLSTANWTVGHWLDVNHYDLDAPYQRGSVWTDDQRRNLMKSLFIGLPVGAVTVSKLPWRDHLPDTQKSYRIVDGKQRIEAVRAFANNEFNVPASWFRPDALSPDAVASGKTDVTWDDLAVVTRRKFGTSMPLPASEFNAETEYLGRDKVTGDWVTRRRSDEEILQAEAELYGLLNGGGTPQTDEDMARARAVAAQPGAHHTRDSI